jgi:hypothetical protein
LSCRSGADSPEALTELPCKCGAVEGGAAMPQARQKGAARLACCQPGQFDDVALDSKKTKRMRSCGVRGVQGTASEQGWVVQLGDQSGNVNAVTVRCSQKLQLSGFLCPAPGSAIVDGIDKPRKGGYHQPERLGLARSG